jgi:hypothetical protein
LREIRAWFNKAVSAGSSGKRGFNSRHCTEENGAKPGIIKVTVSALFPAIGLLRLFG